MKNKTEIDLDKKTVYYYDEFLSPREVLHQIGVDTIIEYLKQTGILIEQSK